MGGVFHCVEMIQITEEFVEAVNGRQELIFVTKVILAELSGGIAHRLQDCGNRHRFGRQADRRSGLPDRRHSGANRKLSRNEVRPTRRAAGLGIIIRKEHAFLGNLVEVGCPPRHQTAMIGTDVPHADVVAHNDDYIGLAPCGLR